MDWALLPVLDYQPHYGIAADRFSALRIKQAPVTLIQNCDDNALRLARSTLPDGAFVIAVFSRLIKVPPVFLGVVRQILLAEPRAHLLIVGTGDPRTVHEFTGDEALRKRVTFIHGNVDLNVYGRVIDVMLDTFPFHAGNACREVAIHGKPVVSLREPEWGILMDDERDSALVAKDHDEYVAIALRLVREGDFYALRSIEARSVSLRVTQTVDMVSEVEQAIERARRHFAESSEPSRTDIGTNRALSRLDQLIVRNVAGKNGGQPFYPGQPDPMAQQFAHFARDLFGADTPAVISNAENLWLAYFLNIYRQSGNSPARGLTVDLEVRREISEIYQSNQSVASPLFLATRFLLGKMYSRISIEEPALELGMGFGDTAKAILGNRKIAVGTTPIVDELMGARHHFGNHRQYLAVDAGQIPFADETFSSIVMNYAFYHLEDPDRACREMMRVLAPGGRIYFNFAIRDRIEPTRVWPKLANELGLRDYGQMASDFVFTDYGGAKEIPTKSGCLALLDKSGFIDVATTDYLSSALSRLIWLTRDLEIMFQMNLHQATARPALESAYRHFVENQMAALLSNDPALCAERDGGTYMFVSARKPGSSLKRYDDAEIQSRMICPVARTPLQSHPGYLWCEQSQIAYPVYQEIALLIPVYGDIWRRQNAKALPDPVVWAPFSY
jgi:ubiquinone/menaquinone biosynthesis C-methylase UbiE